MRLRLIAGLAFAVLTVTATSVHPRAQATMQLPPSPPAAPEPPCALTAPTGRENGIGVGAPKIFDNRTLALMLDTLNESLRNLQVIDAKTLVANLSALQGYQQDSVVRSFNLQGAPLPGVTETVKSAQQNTTGSDTTATTGTATNPANSTTSNTDKETSSSTSSGDVSRQTTTPQRSPTNPDLPATLTAPAFTPQFGQNPGDLLNDQLNLTYQIFNVRMLLDRALSDRLIDNNPKLQAVLGFNISLDPPRDTQDSAAFVEVTLRRRDGFEPVSLVALMPLEKTYNSAALSNRATAFGGSAVSSLLSVGYSERRQSQNFYLFRDNDTIAFERLQTQAAETTFGWAFRPVLGRRSVSPGVRQMFAVISLPERDVENTEVPLTVAVRTYWRHYDRATLTTAEKRTFWQGVGRGVSLGLGMDRPPRNAASYADCVMVPTTLKFQEDLQPEIETLRWRQTDNGTAIVTVRGKNFFQGTTVRIGSKVYATAADGLTLKSDKSFELAVPVSELLGTGVIVGRYGNAIDLVRPDVDAGGIQIQNIVIAPPSGGRRVLDITLTGPKPPQLDNAQPSQPNPLYASSLTAPVVSLGNTVIPPPYELDDDETNPGRVRLRAYASVDQFPTAEGLLTVRFPFSGDRWRRSFPVYDPRLAFSVARFPAQNSLAKLIVTTTDVDSNPFVTTCDDMRARSQWTMTLGMTYTVLPTQSLTAPSQAQPGANVLAADVLEIRASDSDLTNHPLLLTNCDGSVFRLSVPSGKPPDPKQTTFTAALPAPVKLNSASKVTIKGEQLGRVASITANGLTLASRVTKVKDPAATQRDAPDIEVVEVFLERALTKDAGPATLVGRDDKGVILASIDITIQ